MQQREEPKDDLIEMQLEQITRSDERLPQIALILNSQQTKKYLNHWGPWLLLRSTSDKSLTNDIKGLALTIDHVKNQSGIQLRTNLEVA